MKTYPINGSKALGYFLGGIAAASYGLNPTFALPLYAGGMNPDSVLMLRYGLAIPIVALIATLRGRSLRISRQAILPMFILGLLMAISSLTLFISYNYMAAGIASTLLFVYPLMVAVIMAIFYHEKVSPGTLLCIGCAMGGIFLLYNSGTGTTLSPIGTLYVMGSALSYAIYLVAINHKLLSGIPTLTTTFWVLVFGSLLFSTRLIAGAAPFTPPTSAFLWADSIALAIFPAIVSLLCTTKAIQLVGSTPTAILGAIEPLTAVVMGIILFDEQLTGREAVGIVLIIAAVSFVIAGDGKFPKFLQECLYLHFESKKE